MIILCIQHLSEKNNCHMNMDAPTMAITFSPRVGLYSSIPIYDSHFSFEDGGFTGHGTRNTERGQVHDFWPTGFIVNNISMRLGVGFKAASQPQENV